MKSRVSSDRVILSSEKQDFYCTFFDWCNRGLFYFPEKSRLHRKTERRMDMKQPWTETKEALFTSYQTDAHGLSGGEAQKRLAQYGENKLIEGKQKSVLRVFAEQVN